MSARRVRLPLESGHGGERFPGFDVTAHSGHWDDTTRAVVQGRLGPLPAMRFFTPTEEATARALFDQLLYQRGEPRVPVVQLVDARLAELQTDGWHYSSMPTDDDAWHRSLAALDADARSRYDCSFAECGWDQQHELLEAIHRINKDLWHDMTASHVWSLWTRYGCVAFYSHPYAWNEIGFDGPAYPRGYKNLGVDKLEGFEVHDTNPADDPVADS